MATQALSAPRNDARTWNVTLWISQFSLAWLFGVVGVVRAFAPLERIQQNIPWAEGSNDWIVRGSGFALIAVAAALIVPAIIRVGEKLVPATALAMAIIMAVVIASHLIRHMRMNLLVDVVVFVGCVFVAWGRARKLPL